MSHVARFAVSVVLSLLAAAAVDFLGRRRGLLPPRFTATMESTETERRLAHQRRAIAFLLLAIVFFLGVFQPLSVLGTDLADVDLSRVSTLQLFVLHFVLAASLVVWFLLGFSGVSGAGADWRSQFGLVAAAPWREIGLGLLVGLGAWALVLTMLVMISALLYALGAEGLFPSQPPEMVLWIAGLPLGVRLLVSLSAGVVEEAFFRGFLQPRLGIPLSTLLFVLAHLSYEQPLMLLGITLLSLVFAFLVRWRRSIWAAVTAHAVFDGVQLLFLIPVAMKLLEEQGA